MNKLLRLIAIPLLAIGLGCSAGTSAGKTDGGTGKSTSTAGSVDEKGLNLAKFNKIEFDMTYEQVKEIIGEEGELTFSSDFSGESRSYKWSGENYSYIEAGFTDKKLFSKNQSDIGQESGTAEVSMEKFNKIENDMSFEDVTKLIGSESEMMAMQKSGDQTSSYYAWKGPKIKRIYVNFANKKVTDKTQQSLE